MGGVSMDCPKCQGLMISERMTDYSIVFYAWRCVNCGTIVDTMILKNKEQTAISEKKLYPDKLQKAG
jgi:DNA-directed RNA polymerase subunit M/transcription elongation factor TFIIS